MKDRILIIEEGKSVLRRIWSSIAGSFTGSRTIPLAQEMQRAKCHRARPSHSSSKGANGFSEVPLKGNILLTQSATIALLSRFLVFPGTVFVYLIHILGHEQQTHSDGAHHTGMGCGYVQGIEGP